MENNDICNTISEVALEIAKEVGIAGYTGLGIHEETLSDLILNRIRYEFTDNFLTRKFTRKEEGSITGADWLWCIGEPGSWITFAVQAKIVNIDTGKVNYLHYRKGEQHDLLINFCRQFKFIPKYSIYSKIDDGIEILASKLDGLKEIPIEQWSFSMISPAYIKNLKSSKEKHISNVLKYSIPWSYAFCGKKGDGFSLAETVARNLERVYWVFEKEFNPKKYRKTQRHDSRINWENPLPSKFLSIDIPLPVLYLLTKKSFPHKVPIPNVSIFSVSPIQQILETEMKKVEKRRQWKIFPRVFERVIWRIQDQNNRFLLPW